MLRCSGRLPGCYYVIAKAFLGLLLAQIKEAYSKCLWYEISIMIKCVGRVTDKNVILMVRDFMYVPNYKNEQ